MAAIIIAKMCRRKTMIFIMKTVNLSRGATAAGTTTYLRIMTEKGIKNLQQGAAIAAVSTPPGRGAISVIRLSGHGSIEAVRALYADDKKTVERDRTAYIRNIDTGTVRDKCVIVFYTVPASYTGEDSAEICCHGSPVICEEILKFLAKKGVRLAERGEFTRRAFMNGKMDLSASEAVIDMIESDSAAEVNAAFSLSEGSLFSVTSAVRLQLNEVAAEINASIDYPEEDYEFITAKKAGKLLSKAASQLQKTADSYEKGRVIKSGVSVVIAGKPNAGKSTFLNAMLGMDRAIVSDIAGTTRDIVSEYYVFKGRKFCLIDTAGLSDTAVGIEKIGVQKSRAALENADIVLELAEGKDEFLIKTDRPIIRIRSKTDLGNAGDSGADISISARHRNGIDEVKQRIYELAVSLESGTRESDVIITNFRQAQAAKQAFEAVSRAIDLTKTATLDIVADELREALEHLSKIDGVNATDEMLSELFSRFCVGK